MSVKKARRKLRALIDLRSGLQRVQDEIRCAGDDDISTEPGL
jgi:hypothetical protein